MTETPPMTVNKRVDRLIALGVAITAALFALSLANGGQPTIVAGVLALIAIVVMGYALFILPKQLSGL